VIVEAWRARDKPRRSDRAGADGRVELNQIWIGEPLLIKVTANGRLSTRLQWEGRLVSEETAERGLPIVVSESGELKLAARLDAGLELHGRVLHPDRTPVAKGGWLHVETLGRASWEPGFLRVDRVLDREGRATVRLPADLAPATLLVSGGQRRKGWGWEPPAVAASRVVDTNDAHDGVLEVELVAEPLLAIRGRVLTADDGPAASSMVSAVPEGSYSPREATGLGVTATSRTGAEGSFELLGLPLGLYDLYASHELDSFYTFSLGEVCLQGIEAGAEGVELRLGSELGVRIRVSAISRDGPIDRMVVLHARVHPRSDVDAVSLPHRAALRDLSLWPEEVSMDFTGLQLREFASGRYSIGSYRTFETAGHALPPMQAGLFVIAVVPFEQTRRHFPVATGLVRLTDGEYELAFETVGAGSLEGDLVAAEP
jgi:hypothetical protein